MKPMTALWITFSFVATATAATIATTSNAPLASSEQCEVIVRPEGWTPDMAYVGKYCDSAAATPRVRG